MRFRTVTHKHRTGDDQNDPRPRCSGQISNVWMEPEDPPRDPNTPVVWLTYEGSDILETLGRPPLDHAYVDVAYLPETILAYRMRNCQDENVTADVLNRYIQDIPEILPTLNEVYREIVDQDIGTSHPGCTNAVTEAEMTMSVFYAARAFRRHYQEAFDERGRVEVTRDYLNRPFRLHMGEVQNSNAWIRQTLASSNHARCDL